jgi:hypothetical protein
MGTLALMKQLLERADGWLRIVFALSLIWLLIANVIYFSGVGDIRCHSLVTFERDTPRWQSYWNYISFGLDIAQPYGLENTTRDRDVLCSDQSYNIVGHVFLILLPLLYLWSAYAAAKWIAIGFKNK